jgi:hypothetical protein
MTRDDLEERLAELEEIIATDDRDPRELSEREEEHLDKIVSDALEELTEEERNRLTELEEQIESEGFSELGEEPTAAEKEYFDLLFSPGKPNVERGDLR